MNKFGNEATLSILITFCNQDNYISDCLNRILALTKKFQHSCEIIVGLDTPSPSALTSLQLFSDKENLKFFVINSPNNLPGFMRASFVRNHLLKKARGKYSIMLDGDDYFIALPEMAISILETNKNFVGVGHNFCVWDNRTKRFHNYKSPKPKNSVITLDEYVEKDLYVHANCIVFRTDLANKELLLEQFQNDTIFTHWLLSKGNLYFIAKQIMVYRIGILSMFSGSSNLTRLISSLLSTEVICKKLKINSRTKKMKLAYGLKNMPLVGFNDDNVKLDLNPFIQVSKKENLKISNCLLCLLKRSRKLTYYAVAGLKILASMYLTTVTFKAINSNTIPLYYWKQKANLGDALSGYLVKNLFKLRGKDISVLDVPAWKNKKFVAIGSLLSEDLLMTKNIFWGTGSLGESHFHKRRISTDFPLHIFSYILPNFLKKVIQKKNTTILAVRGPLTRSLLLTQGVECPTIYGDPAILLPMVYQPKTRRQDKIGIILHYVHNESGRLPEDQRFSFIDISCSTDYEIEEFIDKVNECSKVFSSSLHGIIVAQTLGIPAQWITFREMTINNLEDSFKFRDYFLGSNQKVQEPIELGSLEEICSLIDKVPPTVEEFRNREELYDAFLSLDVTTFLKHE